MFIGPISILLGGLAVVWVVLTFNFLIRKRNAVELAFSTIDVMLKRRYDLIPNLVACVKGYLRHEQHLLTEITALRARATSGGLDANGSVGLNNQLSARLRQLVVAVEAYPQLRASENFLHLQASLNEAEEQLAASRRAYNAAVIDFNNAVETFPAGVLACGLGWKRRAVLATGETERTTPNAGVLLRPEPERV